MIRTGEPVGGVLGSWAPGQAGSSLRLPEVSPTQLPWGKARERAEVFGTLTSSRQN